MNFTCVDSIAKCGTLGVVKVFDRSYNNGNYDISFFRCQNHPCATVDEQYNISLKNNTIEWTCYNSSVPKNCMNS